MSPSSIKLITFIVLLIHGIGHFQGVVAAFGVKINNANTTQSWLLSNLGETVNQRICLVLFLLAGIMGIMASLAFKNLILPHLYWQNFALICAVLSTICLVLFPNGFAMIFNKIGAVIVNLWIYYAILFSANWPSEIFNN
jgi:hypothetical protein